MKKFYITGNGFIRYTDDNWVTSQQIFENTYTIRAMSEEGYQQVSNTSLN